MEKEIITAILYTEVSEEVGPNPVTWFPLDFSEINRMHISIKTISILLGERGHIPESLVILPFPSLNSKGLIKYIKWEDETRRGGIGQSAITLLFNEYDDVIFYKYINYLNPPFSEITREIINLEKSKADKKRFAKALKNLKVRILNLLEQLRDEELSQDTYEAFPEQRVKELKFLDYKFKIVICGDPEVGKTSLILRFNDNAFRRKYIPTLGVHVSDKIFRVNNSIVQLVLWDIAGQIKFKTMRQQFYRGADGIFLIYDLTKPKSFDNISNWYLDIQEQLKDHPELIGFIVGNKCDLIKEKKVTSESAIELANNLNLEYIETSALSGENVDNAFYNIAKSLYNSLQ